MRGTLSPGSTAHRLRLAVLALALCCGEAAGDAALQFSVADIVGDGWRASGVTFSLQRDDGGRLAARVSAASLELPPPIGRREALAGECRDLVITPRRFTCNELSLGQAGSALPQILLRGRIDYRRDTGALDWDLALPAEQAGDLRLVGRLDAEGWVLDLVAGGWQIEHLGIFGELFGLEPPALAGRLELSFFARGRDTGLQGMVFDLIASDLSGSNDAGTIAAEGLRLALRGSAWADGDRLAFDIRGHAATGEAYVEPVYASLEDYPVRLSARGLAGEHDIILSQLVVEQQDTLHADASARLQRATEGSWQLSHARVKLPRAELPGAYTVLLQPFLTGTPLGDLDSSGVLRGEVTLSHGRLQEARLELVRVNLDDQDGRLAVYDLSGDLAWNAAGHAAHAEPAGPLQLRWSGGFVYGIPFGASSVGLEWRDGLWSLLEPVSIPLLDGALEIDTIELGDFAAGDDTLLFDARLTPVSMRELSHALHWPPLSGQLSGTLPRLRHADGVVALGGEFTAELFGGSMAIRELRIERLLQPRARLRADLELRQLDLAELTEAFAFGLMTGRLEGYVRGLEMIDWAPVAFDARLQTPPGDRSRKRISQRAVDNIASIGGGGAGMLSTGFLRFFESFSYEAFALGCRLENDICQMSGLAEREQGYAILRGRGLPRIDVMGFAHHVSWSALVEQLAGIMESEGPEIR